MLEASFLRSEESWLTPPEEQDIVCEHCGEKIPEGNCYFENEFYLLCESCVLDKLYNAMEIA